MEVYLAAGLTGNLSKFWKSVSMELYIAVTLSRPYVYKKAMEVFLADEHPVKNGKDADWEGLNILETYYYLQNNKEFPRLIGNFQNFLLDSGAFTFMSGAGVVNFDKYVEGYAAFIKKWNVKNFFELDIDSVVGIREVERLREKLERLSGRKPIIIVCNAVLLMRYMSLMRRRNKIIKGTGRNASRTKINKEI